MRQSRHKTSLPTFYFANRRVGRRWPWNGFALNWILSAKNRAQKWEKHFGGGYYGGVICTNCRAVKFELGGQTAGLLKRRSVGLILYL